MVVVTAAADLTHGRGPLLLAALAVSAAVATPGALRVALRRMLPLCPLALVGLGLLLLAPVPAGAPVYQLPGWGRAVSLQSWQFITELWVKSALIVVWVTVVAARLSERGLLQGLDGLGLPSRVTALCYLMVRNLRTITAEVGRLLRARDARGKPRGLRAVRVAGAIAQVLILRLGHRAEAQAFALVARGFDGRLALAERHPLSVAQLLILIALGVLFLWATHL